MVVEDVHVEDIFELVSSVISLIISWTFRILAHEKDQYTDVLSIALKQTEAGPTSFLVWNNLKVRYTEKNIVFYTIG